MERDETLSQTSMRVSPIKGRGGINLSSSQINFNEKLINVGKCDKDFAGYSDDRETGSNRGGDRGTDSYRSGRGRRRGRKTWWY